MMELFASACLGWEELLTSLLLDLARRKNQKRNNWPQAACWGFLVSQTLKVFCNFIDVPYKDLSVSSCLRLQAR